MLFLLQQTIMSFQNKNTMSEKIVDSDTIGFGITIIGMAVVFVTLILIYLIFSNVIKILNYLQSKKKKESTPTKLTNDQNLTGEENAAIAMALSLYMNELHDDEKAVLTIKKVARVYSPWSSKIYGLNQNPR